MSSQFLSEALHFAQFASGHWFCLAHLLISVDLSEGSGSNSSKAYSVMSEDEKCLDRSCFLFVLQGIISLLVMIGCFIMLILDIESRYAQSILTLFVGVWLPSPSVTPITQTELNRGIPSKIAQEEISRTSRTSRTVECSRLTPQLTCLTPKSIVPLATEIKNHEPQTKEARCNA